MYKSLFCQVWKTVASLHVMSQFPSFLVLKSELRENTLWCLMQGLTLEAPLQLNANRMPSPSPSRCDKRALSRKVSPRNVSGKPLVESPWGLNNMYSKHSDIICDHPPLTSKSILDRTAIGVSQADS